MRPVPPAIVVTAPGRSLPEVKREVDVSRDAGADLVEVRFDRLPAEATDRAAELFPSPLPLIATLRSRAEGGEGSDDPAARAPILRALAARPFRWVDFELARDLPVAEQLRSTSTVGQILSSHSLTSVSPAVWGHLLRAPVAPGQLRKVVVPAGVGDALRDLVPDLPPPGEGPLVATTTGPSGPLLRAWSRRFGFAMVFASLPSDATQVGAAVEPSQIPVDRLGPFLRSDGAPPLFGLLGHPVAYSLSPTLHAGWMRARGQPGLYIGLDVATERELLEALPILVEGGLRGANVTQPYKRAALEVATEVGRGAERCGVANTLTFEDEDIVAENTDLVAALRRMEELRDSGRWDGGAVGVVGAGGAARATLAAAAELGAPSILWARRSTAGETVAREFGAEFAGNPAQVRPSLVVNATPFGHSSGESRLPDIFGAWIRPGVHLLDWVYGADDLRVRQTTVDAGASYEDGTRLLVYQGAASFGIWWGEEPSEKEVGAAMEALR